MSQSQPGLQSGKPEDNGWRGIVLLLRDQAAGRLIFVNRRAPMARLNGDRRISSLPALTVTVQADGNTFKGTFTFDVLNLRGSNLQHIAGTLTGTRITVD